MRKIREKYKVKIKVLTPVFIGSGEEYASVQLYLDARKGRVYFVDINRIARDLVAKYPDEPDLFAKITRKDNTKIWLDENLIREHLGKGISEYLRDDYLEADESVFEGRGNTGAIQTKTFIKDGKGEVFIPGSSLKGMAHTMALSSGIREGEYKRLAKNFGFSDAYFTKKEVKVIKVERSMPSFFEVVMSGEAECELRFYDNGISLDEIFSWAERYYKNILSYASSKTKKHLKSLKDFEKEENSIIARIGMGKGFDFSILSKNVKIRFLRDRMNREQRGQRVDLEDIYEKLLQEIRRGTQTTSETSPRRLMRPGDYIAEENELPRISPREIESQIRRALRWPLSKSNLVVKYIRDSLQKRRSFYQMLEGLLGVFPATAWEFKDQPLGWVKLSFERL